MLYDRIKRKKRFELARPKQLLTSPVYDNADLVHWPVILRISRFELRTRAQKPALADFGLQRSETVSQIRTGKSRYIHLLWWPEDDRSAREGARLAEIE